MIILILLFRILLLWLLFEGARKEYATQNVGEKGTYATLRAMELAVPCVMHCDMMVGENLFTKLLREAIIKIGKRVTIESLDN